MKTVAEIVGKGKKCGHCDNTYSKTNPCAGVRLAIVEKQNFTGQTIKVRQAQWQCLKCLPGFPRATKIHGTTGW
jgi:hypothetical protein